MAKEFDPRAMAVFTETQHALAYLAKDGIEGANQTFVATAPLKVASGLLVEWVSVGDADIEAFALTAGKNTTAGGVVRIVEARSEIKLEANLLEAAAADHVLVQTDYRAQVGLAKGANLLGTGLAAWYFVSGGTAAIHVTDFDTLEVSPDTDLYKPAVGDTNARVQGYPLATVLAGN